MENTVENRIPNIKNINEHPLYYGSYMNMGTHNILLLIKHLSERFKDIKCGKINKDDDTIKDNNFLLVIFNTEKKEIPDERRLGIFNYILKRNLLPFLKYFQNELDKQENPDLKLFFNEIHNFLKLIFKEINDLRNDYTHYLSIDKETEEKLERKKSINNNTLKETIQKLFVSTFDFSAKQHFQTLGIKDFEHLKNYKLFKDNSTEYTDYGFYFIACLFLERAYAIQFLKKFRGFKSEQTKPFLATLKAFTQYAVKIPSVKFVNEDKKQTLLTQMLSELNKCPKELYNHLTEDDNKEFDAVHKNEEAIKKILDNSVRGDVNDWEIDEIVRELGTLKRHSDRFPYFALRYIEETDAFKNIRFQISLGKIFIREYPKTIIGEEQNRRISKEIKVFGKLSDFETNEDKILQDLKEIYKNDDIYFEQYAPHYNIRSNKIGIFLFNEVENDKTTIGNKPTAFISFNDLPKLLTLIILQKEQAEQTIEKFINEGNKKMLDYKFLKSLREQLKFKPEEITRRIIDNTKQLNGKSKTKQKDYIDYLDGRKVELNKLLAEHKIQANQLPSEVADYLLKINEPESKKLIHYTIKQMRFDAKQLLKKVKKENGKPKEEQKIKLGELATFLARDFINMTIDKYVKQKITPPYYNKLQKKLAFFSVSKIEIINLCEELNLFDKNKGHVFLTKDLINMSSGIINFYINYLEEKQGIREGFKIIKRGWFDKLAKQSTFNGKNKTDYILDNPKVKIPYTLSKLNTENQETKNLETWLKNKAKMPVNLPINIFDKAINGIFKGKIKDAENKSFSQLLTAFTKEDIQPYYSYKRAYDKPKEVSVFNKKTKQKDIIIEFIPVEIDVKNMTAKNIKEGISRKAKNNEMQIRFYQNKDRVMKLMCEELLKESKTLKSEENILLKDIHPTSEKSPLDKPAYFETTRKQKERRYTIIANDNYKPEDQKGYTWTIKDFGIFNQFINDRRLENLLQYFEENTEIPFEVLEYEIKEYKLHREKVFEEISKIEEAISKKDLPALKILHKENSKYNQLQFKIYLKWLNDKKIKYDEYLSEIRNKFSHSEFPSAGITKLKITNEQCVEFRKKQNNKGYKKEEYKSLSKQIYETYKQKNELILKQIDNI